MAENVTLHLSGAPEYVVRMALITFRAEVKKAQKKDASLGLPTNAHDANDSIALDILKQLGYVAPEERGKGTVEVTREKDGPQIGIFDGAGVDANGDASRGIGASIEQPPKKQVQITCPACSTEVWVDEGAGIRECPGCHEFWRVWCDDMDIVLRVTHLIRVPTDIKKLMDRYDLSGDDALTDEEDRTLKAWMKDNPNHINLPERLDPPAAEEEQDDDEPIDEPPTDDEG